MSNYLNPGNGKFRESLDSDIYVDKANLISYTNRVLSTKQKYICVSHPRRFGKSAAANMLVAYYSRGCDSRALFENLKIAQDPSFEKHLNKYDVIHLDINGILNSLETSRDVASLIKDIRDTLKGELKRAYPFLFLGGSDLVKCLDKVYGRKKTTFVFVIDEWDAPIREKNFSFEDKKSYLDFLLGLLKEKDYVGLAYMTGILPIKKYGTNSGLSMFKEISMTSPEPLQECFGFTEDEVRELSEKYEIPYDDLREWYDGYDVGGISIYNPNSVVNSLTDGKLRSYWPKTETYEDLENYIEDNEYGIHDVILRLLLGESYPVDPDLFANDIANRKCLDDTLTLLVHLGYLTYDSGKGTVRIPNLEIKREFMGTVKRMKPSAISSIVSEAVNLFKSFRDCDEKSVEKSLDSICGRIVSTLEYDNEAALSCAVELSCLSSSNVAYTLRLEAHAGEGVADFILSPMRGHDDPPIIIELKYDKSADEAMGQIKKKRYAEYFKGYEGDIVLIGINCDDETKRHGCLIERYRNA